MEYKEMVEKLVKDYDGIKDNPDYLFRPGFGRDRAYQKLLDDFVAEARKTMTTNSFNTPIYTVKVYELTGAGDLSSHIDTLYFRNKNDAAKVLKYWHCMDIPYTSDYVDEVKYRSIPRGAKIVEEVPWKDAGEALYHLSWVFRNRADKFYARHSDYAPEYWKEMELGAL